MAKCAIPECENEIKPRRRQGRPARYCWMHDWSHLTRDERLERHAELMRTRNASTFRISEAAKRGWLKRRERETAA